VLEFAGPYQQIFTDLANLAREQVRSIEGQVIYMLKSSLAQTGHSKEGGRSKV